VRACGEGALVRREGGVDLGRQHDGALVWQLGARENVLPRRKRPSGMGRLQVDEDDEPVQLRLQGREEPEGSRLGSATWWRWWGGWQLAEQRSPASSATLRSNLPASKATRHRTRPIDARATSSGRAQSMCKRQRRRRQRASEAVGAHGRAWAAQYRPLLPREHARALPVHGDELHCARTAAHPESAGWNDPGRRRIAQ